MSLEFPLVCPGCFCVASSPDDWCEAVERVTRPDQVRHLIRLFPEALLPAGWSPAISVAGYLTEAIARRQLRYIPDPAGCDLWAPPHATIMRGGGDCDDLSALALSLLHAIHVDADMMVGFHCADGRCEGHAWIEGRDKAGYFVIEATTGQFYRSRPPGYRPHYQLRPGRCLDVREERAKQVAIRLRFAARVEWLPS